jgi:hypothetical protein
MVPMFLQVHIHLTTDIHLVPPFDCNLPINQHQVKTFFLFDSAALQKIAAWLAIFFFFSAWNSR